MSRGHRLSSLGPVVRAMVFAWVTAFTLLQGALYLLVGRTVDRRDLVGQERTANLLFSSWWYAVAAVTLARGVLEVLQALLEPDLALQVTYVYLFSLVLVFGLWALSGYLGFLFTGRPVWRPLVLLYAPLLPLLFFVVSYADPVAFKQGQWQVELMYAHDPAGLPAVPVLLVLLFAPAMLGAAAYATLVRRAPTRLLRTRVLLVSLALLVWLGSSLLASLAGWTEEAWWLLTGRAIGPVAAALILFAYRMPAWFTRRMEAAH